MKIERLYQRWLQTRSHGMSIAISTYDENKNSVEYRFCFAADDEPHYQQSKDKRYLTRRRIDRDQLLRVALPSDEHARACFDRLLFEKAERYIAGGRAYIAPGVTFASRDHENRAMVLRGPTPEALRSVGKKLLSILITELDMLIAMDQKPFFVPWPDAAYEDEKRVELSVVAEVCCLLCYCEPPATNLM